MNDPALDRYDNISTNASIFVGYASGGNVSIRLNSNADGVWGRAFQVRVRVIQPLLLKLLPWQFTQPGQCWVALRLMICAGLAMIIICWSSPSRVFQEYEHLSHVVYTAPANPFPACKPALAYLS
jgi:hypothetical protein